MVGSGEVVAQDSLEEGWQWMAVCLLEVSHPCIRLRYTLPSPALLTQHTSDDGDYPVWWGFYYCQLQSAGRGFIHSLYYYGHQRMFYVLKFESSSMFHLT